MRGPFPPHPNLLPYGEKGFGHPRNDDGIATASRARWFGRWMFICVAEGARLTPSGEPALFRCNTLRARCISFLFLFAAGRRLYRRPRQCKKRVQGFPGLFFLPPEGLSENYVHFNSNAKPQNGQNFSTRLDRGD